MSLFMNISEESAVNSEESMDALQLLLVCLKLLAKIFYNYHISRALLCCLVAILLMKSAQILLYHSGKISWYMIYIVQYTVVKQDSITGID